MGLPRLPSDARPPQRERRHQSLAESGAAVVEACEDAGLLLARRRGTEGLPADGPFVVVREHDGAIDAVVVAAVTNAGYEGVVVPPSLDERPVILAPEALQGAAASGLVFTVAGASGRDDGAPARDARPLERLWRLLAAERRLVGSIYIYAALAGLFGLTLPLGVQAIIGLVSGGLLLQPVVLLIAFVILGTMANGMLQLLQLSVVETVQQRVFARFAFALASRLRRVQLERVRHLDLPELMNRFFEVKTIQKSLAKLLTDWVAAGLQVLFGLLLLTFYHPWFAIFGVALLGGLLLVFRLTAGQGWQTSLGESRHKYRVAHWLEELAFSVRVFRFAGASTLPVDRMEHEVGRYLGYRAAHFRVLVRQSAAFVAFKTLITAGLLGLGSILVVQRRITLGQFVAAEIVIVTVLIAVEKLILGLADVYDILTALQKAESAAELPLEQAPGRLKVAPSSAQSGFQVAVEDVSFGFPGSTAGVLRGASLHLAAGERVALAGSHGSGVSTLLHVVSGLYSYDAGAVRLDGVSWRDLDPISVRATIAWCGKVPELFEGTVEENVALGRLDVRTEDVLDALGKVGLDTWLARLPEGLQTPVPVEGTQWSGDIVARLGLARALAGRPRLVLVDGALDALDAETRAALLSVLIDRSGPWTLLLASHHGDVLSRLDRVLRLEDGRVVEGPGSTTRAPAGAM